MQARAKSLLLLAPLGMLGMAQAQPVRGVPIAPGIYAQAQEGCGRASYVHLYRAGTWGDVSAGTPDYPGSAHTFPIRRVAPGRNGYTNIWWDENSSVNGDLSLKPLSGNRFVQRTVSYGSGHTGGRVEVDETTYMLCGFAQLSPRMQAAVRRHWPQLAPGGQAAAAVAAAPAPAAVPPFNIRPGHYVPVRAPCSSPNEMIFYYDGRRFGWIDMSPFNPARMDPVAGARRTPTGWSHLGERVRVLAPDRIATSDPDTGDETLRWCPAGEVRASARAR